MKTEFLSLDAYHRRERILDAAAELFAEYGYDSVTTLQLAEAVGCSETLLFQFFPTKDSVYETLFREWSAKVQEPIDISIIDNSSIKTLRSFFNNYNSRSVSIHVSMRPRLESAIYNRYTGDYRHRVHEILRTQPDLPSTVLAPIIAAGQKKGEIRDGDPAELAKLFWTLLWGENRLDYNPQYQLPFQALQHLFEAK